MKKTERLEQISIKIENAIKRFPKAQTDALKDFEFLIKELRQAWLSMDRNDLCLECGKAKEVVLGFERRQCLSCQEEK